MPPLKGHPRTQPAFWVPMSPWIRPITGHPLWAETASPLDAGQGMPSTYRPPVGPCIEK